VCAPELSIVPPPARIVAHFKDGHLLKGHSMNVDPTKPNFVLRLLDQPPDEEPVIVPLEGLKAVFFVKRFEGDAKRTRRNEFSGPATGRKVAVTFTDGEAIVGTSLTLDPSRPTLFLFPADRDGNNDKLLVVMSAVSSLRKL
jgi:hypothetical protein